MHDWSNPSEARNLINSAKEIIGNNPTKAQLRPIIIKLYKLLPAIERGKGLADDSILTD